MHGQEATGRNRYEPARIGMKGQAGSDGNRHGWQGQVLTGAGPKGTDRDSQGQPETSRDRQEQARTDRDGQSSIDDSCPT
jgi:hypothetical protein